MQVPESIEGYWKMYDAFGKVIKKSILENRLQIDLSDQVKGVYLLEIQFKDQQSIYHKIIKQ